MKKLITIAAIVVLAAATLTGCGEGKAREAVEAASTSQPTATVTTTAPPAPAVTVTAPGPVITTVPQACLSALDDADKGFGFAAEGFDALSDLLEDPEKTLERIQKANEGITTLAPLYTANKAACRAAGN